MPHTATCRDEEGEEKEISHGAGTPLSETIAKQTDRLAFMFYSLGMEYRPIVR